jgi:hypothetical protein
LQEEEAAEDVSSEMAAVGGSHGRIIHAGHVGHPNRRRREVDGRKSGLKLKSHIMYVYMCSGARVSSISSISSRGDGLDSNLLFTFAETRDIFSL